MFLRPLRRPFFIPELNTIMKTFIIYNEENPNSKENALHAYHSFNKFSGWNPIMFNGCWPTTLDTYIEQFGIVDGERTKFAKHDPLYLSKYSCFYSHYALWCECVSLNEPIVIVENDVECTFTNMYTLGNVRPTYNTVMQLTLQSMIDPVTGVVPHRSQQYLDQYNELGEGVHDIFFQHPHGKTYLAGATGYMITPAAASNIINDCKANGWTQNDLLISTELCRLAYCNPSPIRYVKSKELRSSSLHHINSVA